MTALGSALQGPDTNLIVANLNHVYAEIMSMMGSEHARIRRTTAFVVNQIAVNVPQLILDNEDNLKSLVETMILHIEEDKPPIKQFCATTVATLFESL